MISNHPFKRIGKTAPVKFPKSFQMMILFADTENSCDFILRGSFIDKKNRKDKLMQHINMKSGIRVEI